MRHFLFFTSFLLSLSLTAQNTSCKEQFKGLAAQFKPPQLNAKVDSLIIHCEQTYGPKGAIEVAHSFVINRFYARDYKQAIQYSLKELTYYQQLELYNTKYGDVLYNLGRFNQLDRQFTKAIYYYDKAIMAKIDSVVVAKAYVQKGEIAYEQSDPYSAVLYYNKAIAMYKDMGRRATLVKKLLDLARIYEHINTPESLVKKLACLQQIDSLLPKTRVSPRNRMILNNHYASYYNNTSTLDFTKSSFYYQKNIKEAHLLKDSLLLGATYANLANLYQKNNSDSAAYFIKRALDHNTAKADRARILNIQTNYLLAKGKDQEALAAIHDCLVTSTGGTFGMEELPSIAQLIVAPDKKLLLWGLSKRAKVYINQHQKTNDSEALKKAMQTIKLADILIDQMFLGAGQTASKLLWRKTAASIYGMGVYIANALSKEEEAFYFAEKKKALLLTQEVVLGAKDVLLPKPLAQEQKRLIRLQYSLENQLLSAAKNNTSERLQDSLFTITQKQQAINDSITNTYPNYARLLDKTTLISLSEAQKKLQPNTVVLHFIWDYKRALVSQPGVMLITPKHTKYYEFKEQDAILQSIQAFNRAVIKPFTTKESRDAFFTISHSLFNQLFYDAHLKEQIKGKNIVIIPDGPLYNLSFEALLLDTNPAQYLIEQHQISYAQSLSFKFLNATIDRTPKERFLGFAPMNYPDLGLLDLPYAGVEIDQAQAILDGNSYKYELANRATFFKQASSASILHLATHAQSLDASWIGFNDSIVAMHELYTRDIPAEMVVLSGCSTNLGENLEGEGVASLSRAFFYAGANSVVSTLWNANDKTTATISANFYKHLHSGKSKAQALQLAKVNYLKNASLSDASPYYWASMVLIGDQKVIPHFNTKNKQILLFVLLLVFGSLVLLAKEKTASLS